MSEQQSKAEQSQQQQQQQQKQKQEAAEQPPSEADIAEVAAKIEQALAHKARGTEHVKNQEWKKASFEYKHIALFLNNYASSAKGGTNEAEAMMALVGKKSDGAKASKEQLEVVRDTIFATHLNLSLVSLNLGRFTVALSEAEEALAMRPDATKARYRRARARLAVGMADEAGEDFRAVLKSNPEDPAAQAGLKDVEVALAAAREKEKKMCSKMFA